MTREEALDLISDVEKFYCESADEYGYYCYEAESVIDQIYDEHEAQMKAKDEEIERLKAEIECAKNIMNGVMQGDIITQKCAIQKARSIVSMLFWIMKRQKAIYITSFNELGINNHITSFYKGAYENSNLRFKQAYKMLKENA